MMLAARVRVSRGSLARDPYIEDVRIHEVAAGEAAQGAAGGKGGGHGGSAAGLTVAADPRGQGAGDSSEGTADHAVAAGRGSPG
ncbi:hypothetical protein PHYPSEUDO_013050 [Phytophthora pseudosyringae]|uniref:Uncharacterized protein n=1 Tax=Phytophthora pseudosyringae TaxID=221518 RepID=A0A8T1V940_9STRA|nr:hypothetical protein PHYPSEUDO_013050 [Phytophthora pseudosyringae]